MLQYDYRVIGYEMKYVVVCEPSTGAAVGLRIGVMTGGWRNVHPGELVAKVGYFGVKSAKVCRAQMGDQNQTC